MVLQFGLSEEYDRLQISRLIPLLRYWPEENLAIQVTVSVSINMPTVPTTVFEGKAKYSTYDDAVGVTSSMLKISCPKEVAGVKLSLITNDKITGNDKAIASSNDTVGYYLYLGDNSDVLDVSAPFNIESYKTAEGQYAIPFKAKYLKLTDNSVQSGDVLSSLVMRVAQD